MSFLTPEMIAEAKRVFDGYFDAELIDAKYAQKKAITGSVTANTICRRAMTGLQRAFEAVLPGRMDDAAAWEEFANAMLPHILQKDYVKMSNAVYLVQSAINKAAGINLSVIRPTINQDRADGIVKNAVEAGSYSAATPALSANIVNFNQNISAASIRANAELHYNAGLNPKIVRKANAKACAWCKSIAGTVAYADIQKGAEIFRRHVNCTCQIELITGTQRETVQNYRKAPDASADKIAYRKTINAPDDRKGVRT